MKIKKSLHTLLSFLLFITMSVSLLTGCAQEDLELATEVVVSLMENGRVVKKAEREGIYRALDIGAFWLEDAMSN